jgi:hypothetical protein
MNIRLSRRMIWWQPKPWPHWRCLNTRISISMQGLVGWNTRRASKATGPSRKQRTYSYKMSNIQDILKKVHEKDRAQLTKALLYYFNEFNLR